MLVGQPAGQVRRRADQRAAPDGLGCRGSAAAARPDDVARRRLAVLVGAALVARVDPAAGDDALPHRLRRLRRLAAAAADEREPRDAPGAGRSGRHRRRLPQPRGERIGPRRSAHQEHPRGAPAVAAQQRFEGLPPLAPERARRPGVAYRAGSGGVEVREVGQRVVVRVSENRDGQQGNVDRGGRRAAGCCKGRRRNRHRAIIRVRAAAGGEGGEASPTTRVPLPGPPTRPALDAGRRFAR